MKFQLRDYQLTAEDNIRAVFRQGFRAPLCVMPTGSGKTVTFSSIAEQASAKGNCVMIVVHRRELLDQACSKLDSFDVEHGVICPGRTMSGHLVQVASVDTLINRLNIARKPDMIIVDEAHHCVPGNKWGRVLTHYATRVLGVTATPIRSDGIGLGTELGGFFDTMVTGPTISSLIKLGHLSRPVTYAPNVSLDLNGVTKSRGDYVVKQLESRIDKAAITGNCIEHYKRICYNTPAIAFCTSVKHANHVAEQFNEAGIPAASIDGNMLTSVRQYRIKSLAQGGIKVLTSCDIVSEGTDIPVVQTAILLRPTESEGLFLQQCGRVLRPFEGKKCAYILDHAGNTHRHGLIEEDRTWLLSKGANPKDKKASKDDGEKIFKIAQCPKCFAANSKLRTHCEQCGAEIPKQYREIEEKGGELAMIDEQAMAAMAKRRLEKREQGGADSLAALKALAQRRGYKPGWAEHIYRSRQAKKQQIY